MKDSVIKWLMSGDVGVSSRAMVSAVFDIDQKKGPFGLSTPSDPSDFNRCLKLIKAVPEIKNNMGKVAGISDRWSDLIERWDEVEKSFLDEAGFDWCKSSNAPLTYKLMKEIGC